jgi:phosphoenolpyruvate carboxykinase (GTP)
MSAVTDIDRAPTTHSALLAWVRETAELTGAERIHWCDGSAQEWTQITDLLVASGTFTRLNPALKPNSFWAASDPSDVARVEDQTYICSVEEKDASTSSRTAWVR